jgi:anti-anti-sigma factor
MTDQQQPFGGPAPGRLKLDRESSGGTVTITVHGELDLQSVPDLDRALLEAQRERPDLIVIDCAGLDFTDSTGLRALLRAQQRADHDGHQLGLRSLPDHARRLFEMTGTQSYFTILD